MICYVSGCFALDVQILAAISLGLPRINLERAYDLTADAARTQATPRRIIQG